MANNADILELINKLGFIGIKADKVAVVLGMELHTFSFKGYDEAEIEKVLGKPFMEGVRILYKVGEEGTISISKRNKTVTYAVGLEIYNHAMSLPPHHPNAKFVRKN